ncbi:ABC transporter substrate-binding protein [Acerihabitans sp.]|uniref:ABC transporter substrate-binding protein n=1 Tax=Acerihabitans sp. TaxID=2811394 RepID=UPI002ED777B6
MRLRSSTLSLRRALLAAALLSTLTGAQAFAAGKLVWAVGVDADSLDPHRTTTWESWATFDLLYDSLLQFDAEGKVVPNLAKSWDVAPDGKAYTFHLNPGMQCSDGTPLDANDVKYTLDRAFDSKNPSVMKAGFGPVTAVTVEDPLTVKFTLSSPFGAFLAFMGEPFASIICDSNQALGKEYGSSKAIGSGPFMVKSWVKGDRMVLVPNPRFKNYGRPVANPGPPAIDELIIRRMPEAQARLAALETGEVQIATPPLDDVETVRNSSKMTLQTADKTGSTIFFEFTTTRPPFNDERVRKAVAYAVDPDAAIDIVFGDVAKREHCAVGPGVFGNDESWCATQGYQYDPEKAKALLKEAGFGPDKPLDVTVMTWPDDNREKILQVFQNQLQQVGIKATIELMDIGTLNARVKQENETKTGKGSFNMMGWGWYDPDILYNLWHSPGAYAGYQTPELDAILDKTRTTLDPVERMKHVRDAQTYLLTHAVQVPLYTPGWNWIYGVRNEVKGFKVSAFNRPIFNDVTVQ